MNPVYRLYGKLESSVFDLIEGEREVQQTKGLALLLAKDPEFLSEFMNMLSIDSATNGSGNRKKVVPRRHTRIIVNSELTSLSGKRIDVAISFYTNPNHKPDLCVIIEAKSINKQVSASAVVQVKEYIDTDEFPQLSFFEEKKGFVLTKNKILTHHADIGCLTWDDVVRVLVINPATKY